MLELEPPLFTTTCTYVKKTTKNLQNTTIVVTPLKLFYGLVFENVFHCDFISRLRPKNIYIP